MAKLARTWIGLIPRFYIPEDNLRTRRWPTNTGAEVNHTYTEQGTYQILVNLTDNDGLSSTKTFQITVENQPLEISSVIKIILASIFGFVLITMIILVLRRIKKASRMTKTDDRTDNSIVSSSDTWHVLVIIVEM